MQRFRLLTTTRILYTEYFSKLLSRYYIVNNVIVSNNKHNCRNSSLERHCKREVESEGKKEKFKLRATSYFTEN